MQQFYIDTVFLNAETGHSLRFFTTILFFLLPGFHLPGAAQRYDNWYFGGRAGIHFSSGAGSSTPQTIPNSVMDADEACASISDRNGNLLFYTNGVTVYNQQHQVMLNGDQLSGDKSACQVIIIPHPGNDSLYYLFTGDAVENDFQRGYRYSIVNINRDGGKGEVLSKNTLLWSSCTERIAAARHVNGIDVWLVTNDQNSNVFRSWLITCNGLQASPVVSTAGTVLDFARNTNTGVMKLSPDGKFLCQTHFPIFDENTYVPNFVQLLDFDNATGIISNARRIGFSDAQYLYCEFSPGSRQLYLGRTYDSKIDQFDISLPTTNAILASRFTFNTTSGHFDMQLGPDEKIYCARPSHSLAVINEPDTRGAGCDWRERQVVFQSGLPKFGLPGAINDVVPSSNAANGFTVAILDSCGGTVQFSGYSNLGTGTTWTWNFGDGSSSTLQNPVHSFTPASAEYAVSLVIRSSLSCGIITVTKRVKPGGGLSGTPRFGYEDRCDSGYVRFTNLTSNAAALSGNFVWDFGDGNTSTAVHPIHSYPGPGTYWATLKIYTGLRCLDDSVRLPVEVKAFIVETIPDQVIYVGQSVNLSTTQPGISFHWSPATWLNDSTIRNPVATPLEDITYRVSALGAGGCAGEDSVRITVLQFTDIFVPTGFTPNNDGRNDLLKPFFGKEYTLTDFSVYNRWGQRIYQTSRRGAGWDGRIGNSLQAAAVYTWTIRLQHETGQVVERKGTSALIR